MMHPKKIILASNNNGKLLELSQTLAPLNIQLLPQSDYSISDIEETGLSFVENALLKARHASSITKLPAIADDSGLVVPALNGAPGIYSARYSGTNSNAQSNIKHLLKKMANVTNRIAYFYCALVYVKHALDPAPLISVGQFYGTLLKEQKGNHGFGYDPIFFLKEYNQTAAELDASTKNQISHRAIASKALLRLMKQKEINAC